MTPQPVSPILHSHADRDCCIRRLPRRRRVARAGDRRRCAGACPGQRETGPAPDLTRDQKIDALLQTLKTTKDETVAAQAEDSLAAIWMESGSPTVDLMMEWTEAAMKQKNYPLALDYLDRILTLKSDYAEGWNTRATVYFLNDDFVHAVSDLRQVLRLEPRHFDALAGLGAILREVGQDKEALAVFQQALAVDPHLDSVRKAVDDLNARGVGGTAL
ncbi:MAG: tetratricopeptide repeat protein [Bauldia sp.]